eukprot:CAMPEP_0198441374 /NCGR_PEP_ID=MMETSP1452-20131203/62401_1 /TAXON_ID=1181717 /ORGANISM="Synchroma pusillum, Strain CCMP3072" /LENGTH=437 /DNA_ID=CAMNT_0044161999 /DNA_START=18 /DNA_END=1328 /DNA_ORIENTATION=-
MMHLKVTLFDDQDRIDSQQNDGWLNTHMQEAGPPEFAWSENKFHEGLCRRVVWSHRVTDGDIMKVAHMSAVRNDLMEPSDPNKLPMNNVCHGEGIRSLQSPVINREVVIHPIEGDEPESNDGLKLDYGCLFSLGKSVQVPWAKSLCKHNYIFVRGQHHTGTGLVRSLITTGTEDKLSSFEQRYQNPQVPEYEGQFFQSLWPLDNPSEPRAKFCGCDNDAQIGCMYLCPARAWDWASDERKKKLFDEWRLFWDMSKQFLLEKSPEMGASHLRATFPNSKVVYVMRHPLSLRVDYQRPACARVEDVPKCIDTWLNLWRAVPIKNTLIVRYESAALYPQLTSDQLQARLELRTEDEIRRRAREHPPLDLVHYLKSSSRHRLKASDGAGGPGAGHHRRLGAFAEGGDVDHDGEEEGELVEALAGVSARAGKRPGGEGAQER